MSPAPSFFRNPTKTPNQQRNKETMPYINAEDASPTQEEPSTKTANGASSRSSYASAGASVAPYTTPATSHQPQSTTASPKNSAESIRPKGSHSGRVIQHSSTTLCGLSLPTQAPPVLPPPPALQTPTPSNAPAARAPLSSPHDAFLNRPPVVYRSYRNPLPEPRSGASGSSGSPNRWSRSRPVASAAKQMPAAPGPSTGAVQRPAPPFPFTIPSLQGPEPLNRIVGLPDSAPCRPHRVEPPCYVKPPPQFPKPTSRTPPRPLHPHPSPTPHFPPPPPLSSGGGYGHPAPNPSASPHHTPPTSARHAAFVDFATLSPQPYTHSPYTSSQPSSVFHPPWPPSSPPPPPYQYYQHMVASLVGFPPDFAGHLQGARGAVPNYTRDNRPAAPRYEGLPPMVVNAALQPVYRRPEDHVDGIGAMVGLTLEEVMAGWRAPTKGEGTYGEAVRVEDVKKRKREGEDEGGRERKRLD